MGTAPAVAALRAQIRHLATFDTVGNPHVPTVLLQGETGTGKGLVARILHDSGPRGQGPFIAVNCAAIPDTMLEAELFGFEAGAFTDAKRAKPGLCEGASGGTLFLDEIDAVPLTLQGTLLTAIESEQVRRLGAVRARVADVKLIAVTNANLPEAVAAGRFRAVCTIGWRWWCWRCRRCARGAKMRSSRRRCTSSTIALPTESRPSG